MITGYIREHNYLNGFKFVIVEFTIATIIAMPFTFYYFLHKRYFLGIIGFGIIANFCVYIFFCIQSLRKKEKSIGIAKLFNKKVRGEIEAKYAHLGRKTLILTIASIIPYLMIIFALVETRKPGFK